MFVPHKSTDLRGPIFVDEIVTKFRNVTSSVVGNILGTYSFGVKGSDIKIEDIF